jgi:hypothetical protein
MKVTRTISREALENVFVTALEGGSNYWYTLSEKAITVVRTAVPKSQNLYFATAMLEAILDHNVEVPINDVEEEDDEDSVLGVISLATMNDRLQKLAESDDSWALDEVLDEEYDSTSADVVFQYIVMGEVVFG